MKKLIAIVFGLSLLQAARATVTLPYYDAFNYAEGRLNDVAGGNWIAGSSGTEISVTNPATLTAPAGFAAAAGKGVRRANSGTSRRSVLQFTSISATDGNVLYVSFLVNVQTAPASAQLILHVDNSSASVTSPDMGFFVDNGPKIGIGKNAAAPGFTEANNLTAGTHLVVGRYTFQSGNDKVDLWVDPSSSDYGAASAPTPDGTHTNSGDPTTSIDYCQIVAPSGAGPVIYIDEFRVGTAWADVVPAGGPLIGAKLGFTTQPANAAPNATMNSVVVQVQTSGGAAVASNGVPVTLTLSSGTGTLSGTTTQNTDASGKATFSDLSIDQTGTKQLTAAASGIGAGLASTVSSNFSIIVAGQGTKLAFTTQPANAQTNASLGSVVVQIQDASSVNVSSNNVPVTLTLSSGTGTLSGTTTQNTDATGKATFSNLSIDQTGAKQLTAGASGIGTGLANATSASFTISAPGGGGGAFALTQVGPVPNGFKTIGSGAGSNVFCQILGAVDPSAPTNEWIIVQYQNSDVNGGVNFTNPVSPALPHAFYRLRTGDTTTKLQPPSIGIPPQSQIVSPGSNATFTVTAVGPILQYLWYFNGNPIAGATGTSISIPNAQPVNAGNYYVAVANPAGFVNSAIATLGVSNVAPSITSQPANQTVTAGGTAIFTVGAMGTAPLTYQWFSPSGSIVGATNSVLTLSNVQTNQGGAYHAVVTGKVNPPATSANATLTVNAVPTGLPDTNMVGWAAFAGVTGGTGGSETNVSTYAALRAVCRATGPLIIHVSGIIVPNEAYCYVEGADKTIIGDSTNAGLAGAGFRLAGTNIIVQNMSFNSTNSNSDGITIDNSSHGIGRNIWIDHCDFYDCTDGSVDITKGADYVTISWCKFHYAPVPDGVVNHEFVDLIGSSDTDSGTSFHVTFHHNWYTDYSRERMPSVRFGHVHVFNNYYDCRGNNYCVRTRIDAEVLVENNYFLGVQNPWERFDTTGTPGKLYASGNITNNCTFVNGWVAGAVVIPGNDTLGSDLNPPPYTQAPYTFPPMTATTDVPYYVQTYAGSGKYPYVP